MAFLPMGATTTQGLALPTWDEDPVRRLAREFKAVTARRADILAVELQAIAALITAHRDEFDELVDGISGNYDAKVSRRLIREALDGEESPS